MSGEENLTEKIDDNTDSNRRRKDRRKEQIPVESDRRKGGDRRLNAQLMEDIIHYKLIPLGKMKRVL